jgi:hypothetical protein
MLLRGDRRLSHRSTSDTNHTPSVIGIGIKPHSTRSSGLRLVFRLARVWSCGIARQAELEKRAKGLIPRNNAQQACPDTAWLVRRNQAMFLHIYDFLVITEEGCVMTGG